jgi:hypothetical protein
MNKPIKDDEIVAKLEEFQQLERDTKDYFRLHSPLWRAIVNYITDSKPHKCVLGDKKLPVRIFKGSGAGVRIKKIYAKPPGAYPDHETTIRFVVDVNFIDPDDERDYASIWMIDVPISLVEHFTKEGFNKWIAEKEAEHLKKENEKDLKELKEIIKRNPDILKHLKDKE